MEAMEMLNRFCDANNERFKSPFSIGDYTYATNGFIIIRIPRLLEFREEDQKFISLVPWDHDKLTDWFPIPTYSLDNAKICCNCSGIGKQKTCSECKGFGIVTTNTDYNEYENTCRTCDGEGTIGWEEEGDAICVKCNGTGRNINTPVMFGNRHISMKILERIKNLPDIKLSKFGDYLSPVRFIFNGGVGLFMPMNL